MRKAYYFNYLLLSILIIRGGPSRTSFHCWWRGGGTGGGRNSLPYLFTGISIHILKLLWCSISFSIVNNLNRPGNFSSSRKYTKIRGWPMGDSAPKLWGAHPLSADLNLRRQVLWSQFKNGIINPYLLENFYVIFYLIRNIAAEKVWSFPSANSGPMTKPSSFGSTTSIFCKTLMLYMGMARPFIAALLTIIF